MGKLKGLLGLALAVGLIAALTTWLSAQPSTPGPVTVSADLSGYQEVPAISTTGTGEFRATIDDMNRTIDYALTYSDLEGGAALFAHIHLGQRGVSGGVSAFLCGGGGKPPCPASSGTVTGTIGMADVIGPTGQGIEAGSFEELVRAIRSGVTYANVHTPRWPGGEIRGQIFPAGNNP